MQVQPGLYNIDRLLYPVGMLVLIFGTTGNVAPVEQNGMFGHLVDLGRQLLNGQVRVGNLDPSRVGNQRAIIVHFNSEPGIL